MAKARQAEEQVKTYEKQTWVDHFVDENGEVLQQGTAMDALHLNHIEEGIEKAHDLIADLEKGTTPAGKVAQSLTIGDKTFDGSEEVTIDADDGLEIKEGTIRHTNEVEPGTAEGSDGEKDFGDTVEIPSVTYDAQGHITGVETTEITLPDNDATESEHGLMSADDKEKLNGIAEGATKVTNISDLIGNAPIGNKYAPIYYDGSKFVAQPFSLQDASWDTIAKISEGGDAPSLFNVGDEKTIELTTGEKVTLVVLGFNHDDLTAGGKAGITFGMKDLLSTKYVMNSSGTNANGWDGSAMRTSTMQTILSQLPDDLKNVIKNVNKKATAGSQSTEIVTSSDKLWLLAMAEIYSKTSIEGSTTADIKNNAATYEAEGEQYAYYRNLIGDNSGGTATNSKLIKYSNGSAYNYLLRSPSIAASTTFRYVGSGGSVSYNIASVTSGVCFGFCV